MSRSRPIRHARTITLAIVVAASGVACAAPGAPRTTDAPPSGSSTSVRNGGADALIANARAAQRQHDWRSLRGFQAQLIERVGLSAVREARGSYQRAVADLAAASERGDSQTRAGFRAELRAMCGPNGLVRAFESCGADMIVWGG